VDYPDIQFHFLPLAVRYDGKAAVKGTGSRPCRADALALARGHVRLALGRSEGAAAHPLQLHGGGGDWTDFRHCIRLTREIFAQAAFAPYAGDRDPAGGGGAARRRARRLHPRTCGERLSPLRHGADGPARRSRGGGRSGVPGDRRRGLRVADSSIFPRITNGNLNAPSIMVGEKAADHVLGRAPLPRSNLEPWINPHWRVADR
jgi:choline dehydrogenase